MTSWSDPEAMRRARIQNHIKVKPLGEPSNRPRQTVVVPHGSTLNLFQTTEDVLEHYHAYGHFVIDDPTHHENGGPMHKGTHPENETLIVRHGRGRVTTISPQSRLLKSYGP